MVDLVTEHMTSVIDFNIGPVFINLILHNVGLLLVNWNVLTKDWESQIIHEQFR